MPSISAPSSPHKEELSGIGGKWISSCSDIADADEVRHEATQNPIKVAQWRALRDKRLHISKFLDEHRDEGLHHYIDELRHFAVSRGGLIDDDFRAEIWPVLADNLIGDGDSTDSSPTSSDSDFESALSDVSLSTKEEEGNFDFDSPDDLARLKTHKEWNQVNMDVQRTLARFPPNITDVHRSTLQDQLTPLIVRILMLNSNFNYYQGFHDVCLTLLLVVGRESAYRIGVRLVRDGIFNSFLLKTLEDSVVRDLDLVYVILSRTDPELEKVMRSVRLGALFALSWPLTWFSHCLHNYQQIVRCFDLFFASQPLAPIYVSAALVMYRRHSVFSVERDMPFIHQCLNNVPHELPIDELLSDATYLAKLMPSCLLKGRYLEEYRRSTNSSPVRRASQLSRYTLQLAFMGVAGAAAGYFLMNKYHF